MLQTRVATASIAGNRSYNEDAVLLVDELPLFAVADGMGGRGVGDRAAAIALHTVESHLAALETARDRIALDRSTAARLAFSRLADRLFQEASARIREAAIERSLASMGSTLLVATVAKSFLYVAHVGDSRAYLLRDGVLHRLTEDHSVAEYRYRRGKISREEYEKTPERRVLYQTLGTGVDLEVDVGEVRLRDGDRVLLCTDGLTRSLDEARVRDLLGAGEPGDAAEALIRASEAANPPDNVTLAVIEVHGAEVDAPLDHVAETLRDVFLFGDMSHQELLLVAPYLDDLGYDAGEAILVEGGEADHFFVVVDGSCAVTRAGNHLVTVTAGGYFGEMELASESRNAATVTATTPTRVLALSRGRFHELIQRRPDLGVRIALALLDAMGGKLREVSDKLARIERIARGD